MPQKKGRRRTRKPKEEPEEESSAVAPTENRIARAVQLMEQLHVYEENVVHEPRTSACSEAEAKMRERLQRKLDEKDKQRCSFNFESAHKMGDLVESEEAPSCENVNDVLYNHHAQAMQNLRVAVNSRDMPSQLRKEILLLLKQDEAHIQRDCGNLRRCLEEKKLKQEIAQSCMSQDPLQQEQEAKEEAFTQQMLPHGLEHA